VAEKLHEFAVRNRIVIPNEFAEWLAVINGARTPPGGILGIRPDDPYCDIQPLLAAYPEWNAKGWIPIAGDGCGNYYVVYNEGELNPLLFIDTTSSHLDPALVAASGVWKFFWFLLSTEIGKPGWPFSREFVIRHDPD